MFPLMASSISASVGLGFFASSAAAAMICPDWQYPHCGTASWIQAFCTGCDASAESPSIVVIFFPATLETGVMQDRVTSPLMCTVHAPHSAIPQPNFVPVMFSVSRSTHRSGMSGLTSTVCGFPFRVKLMAIEPSLPQTAILQQFPVQIEILDEYRRNIDYTSHKSASRIGSLRTLDCVRPGLRSEVLPARPRASPPAARSPLPSPSGRAPRTSIGGSRSAVTAPERAESNLHFSQAQMPQYT